jgi:hypothetical protein
MAAASSPIWPMLLVAASLRVSDKTQRRGGERHDRKWYHGISMILLVVPVAGVAFGQPLRNAEVGDSMT